MNQTVIYGQTATFSVQVGGTPPLSYQYDLSDSTWQLLKTVTADMSGQLKITDSAGADKRFYRIGALWSN